MAFTLCRLAGTGPGPLSSVWRRVVTGTGSEGPWQRVGQTCLAPDQTAVPGDTGPGYAQIRQAWTQTRFARATPVIQPVGNQTLVNLPTFLAVGWATTGHRPGQHRSVTLAGQNVRIRATLRYFEYDFGDGHTTRTRSPGGPYPDGDIRRSYPRHGSYRVRIVVGYGGEYSINSGSWFPLRETIRIPGPASTLQVLSADNVLVPT
ncbi:MAG TPA: hypothetical protein VES01_08540 [Dermatophilaceae bacterium]|nr:hypothetical protein [Dermatophilaceae bacterium]